MNPFNNNKPNLTSSDRIRDKKSAYIYNTTKKKFQMGKKTCGSKNIKFYKKGTVRSVSSYKMQQDLARGNILCEDCNDKGMLCTPNINRKNLEKTTIANNAVSEFWGGSTLTPWLRPDLQVNPSQEPGFTVIQTDISGAWDGISTDPSKSIIGPDASINTIPMPYGYIKNLINIPRNLNGYGIEIDASGMLFPSSGCGTIRYMKNVQEKIIVQVTAELTVFIGIPGDSGIFFSTIACKNPMVDLNILKGTYVLCRGQTIEQTLTGSETIIFIGVVKDVCCDCVLTFNIELFFMNRDIGVPQFGTPFLNDNSSTLPDPWYDITVDFWGIRKAIDNYISANTARGGAARTAIKSFKVIQGDPCYSYALSYNNRTRQNYMSCLEDKTKKINFKKSKLFTCVQQNNQGPSCFRAGDCSGGTIADISLDTVFGLQTFRTHTFDVSGTFTITYPYNIDTASGIPMTVMLVGGGGGGGGGSLGGGGGGGAGGSMNVPPDTTANTFRLMDPNTTTPNIWAVQVIIGEGGEGGTAGQPGFQGGITQITPPASAGPPPWPFVPPLFTCYFGGGGYTFSSNNGGGEAFCSFLGGSTGTTTLGGGGDGGCFQPGTLNLNLGQDASGVGNFAGDGGDGQPITITGTPVTYGGGGGGGAGNSFQPGTGGAGGGGNGSNSSPGAGIAGTGNSGGGGGGGGSNGGDGGNGGSGRVIIRYRLCT